MVDNQHKKITGYRDLSQFEINMMNDLKSMEETMRRMLGNLKAYIDNDTEDKEALRWVAEARTCLETGMMYAIKAVARPTNGLGRLPTK